MDPSFDWEAMSERCVEALVKAQQEAEFLKAAQVGTEHVLIGLLGGRNVGAQLLAEHGADVHIVRATLEKFRARDQQAAIRRFSWRVKRAVEIAFEEAGASHSPFMNTDHLYVGLLSQPDSTAAAILGDVGVPLDHVLGRLRTRRGASGETDLLFAADLLDQLRVADTDVPEMEQVSARPTELSLDRFLEVLDDLGRALQTAQQAVQSARPFPAVHLDIPEVAETEWPVVDEEAYQIAGLVRQILSQMVARGAERLVFVPCEGALHVEYHRAGSAHTVEIPAILRTVVPFKVMRMASLNPMEKGRELEGQMTFRVGDRAHDLRVRSEPVHRGLRVEVWLL